MRQSFSIASAMACADSTSQFPFRRRRSFRISRRFSSVPKCMFAVSRPIASSKRSSPRLVRSASNSMWEQCGERRRTIHRPRICRKGSGRGRLGLGATGRNLAGRPPRRRRYCRGLEYTHLPPSTKKHLVTALEASLARVVACPVVRLKRATRRGVRKVHPQLTEFRIRISFGRIIG